MSDRKRFVRSASKEKSNLNSTIAPRHPLKPLNMLNTTIVPTSPTEDLDLEYELAYTEYLNALALLNVTEETVKQHNEKLDQQLAQQTDNVTKGLHKINKQLEVISELELQINIAEAISHLKQNYCSITHIACTTNMSENLTTVAQEFFKSSNKIYLTNMNSFKSQEDYDQLESLIKDCIDTTSKFKAGIDHFEDTNGLAIEMQKFVDLQTEVIKNIKSVKELVSNAEFLIFKNASDRFAADKTDIGKIQLE